MFEIEEPGRRIAADVKALRDEIEGALARPTPLAWDEVPVDGRPGKTRVTIRLDQDVVRFFRDMGPGWQTRLNAVLRLFYEHRK